MLIKFDIWDIAKRFKPASFSLLCIAVATFLAVSVSHLFWYALTGAVPDGLTIVAGGAAIIVALPLVNFFTDSVYSLHNANERLLNTKTKLNFKNEELAKTRDAVSELNMDLEARVAARTAELEAALREAEKANASKSIFLANMSHELRTPLNAIIGYAEMIANRHKLFADMPSERLDDYATAIFASGHHLNAMVNDLLDLSRIEFEQFDYEPVAIPAKDLINEVLAELGPKMIARHQTVDIELAGDDVTLYSDRRATHQILTNLLSNALKYSHEGQSVTISVERAATMTSLIVTDYGIGMSEDSIAKATEPFSRFSNAHIASGESIGLGLSIVNKLCNVLGSKLSLNSIDGSGTIARVDFPSRSLQVDTAPALALAS